MTNRGVILLGLLAACSGAPQPKLVATVKPVHAAPAAPAGPRLPRTFAPVGYRVRIAVGDRLYGHMEITADLKDPETLLWLHGADLEVTGGKATQGALAIPFDVSHSGELLALEAAKPLAPGRWTLVLEYTAPITTQPTFPASETMGAFAESIAAKTYVFTQFEPFGARRVFPCVDEPDVKVPWQLTLDVTKGLVAASNTPVVKTTSLDEHHDRVEFAPTPPLPSYLVAFAVGAFDVVDAASTASGAPIRLLVENGAASKAAMAAQVTPHVLDALERYLGINYPYPKLDLVAVPLLRPLIAMENPGLVTFDARLLEPGAGDRALWTFMIAHELSHQWFGDLVTPAWWDDLWLNEGFASWLTDKVLGVLDPRRASELLAAQDRIQALPSAEHPIAIRAPAAATAASATLLPYFDGTRGAQLIRMLEKLTGADSFRAILHDYLTKHANGTVTAADLIAALGGPPLDRMITDYLDRPSVPELAVETHCDGKKLALRLAAPADRTIPACVAYDQDGARAEACIVVPGGVVDLPITAKACPRWVLPNASGLGFYRGKLSLQGLGALLDRGWPALTPAERFTVIGELTDRTVLLAISPKLVEAGDPVSVYAGIAVLDAEARFVPDDLRPRFDAWVQQHLGALARDVHFKIADGDPDTSRRQIAVVSLVAKSFDGPLTAEATALAPKYRDVPYAFVGEVLALAANHDPSVASQLVDEAMKLGARENQYRIVEALGSLRDLFGLLTRDSAKLASLPEASRIALVARLCDGAQRAAEEELARRVLGADAPQAIEAIGRCIARRQLLDPVFRAWLGAKRP